MSNCCKCAKWWPHNWLCLKGLYVIFVVLFYISLVYGLFQAYAIFTHPQLEGTDMWLAAGVYIGSDLAAAVGFLTVAQILKAIRKIKKAVAPCGCSVETEETPAESVIEKVVEQESK